METFQEPMDWRYLLYIKKTQISGNILTIHMAKKMVLNGMFTYLHVLDPEIHIDSRENHDWNSV